MTKAWVLLSKPVVGLVVREVKLGTEGAGSQGHLEKSTSKSTTESKIRNAPEGTSKRET